MDFDWHTVLSSFALLGVAYALALPIAWDREAHARSAGLRTFPLVAIATCGYTLLAFRVFPHDPDAQARVIQGLVAGIGFVGGGAILKQSGSVQGTATAASIWNTGAIGVAVAYARYEIAIVLSVVNLLTLLLLSPLKDSDRTDGRDRS